MNDPKKNEAKQDYLKRCTDAAVKAGKDRRGAFAACNAVWDSKHNASLAVTVPVSITALSAEQLAAGGDDARRGFLITAKTGKPVQRGYYVLAIDMAGVRTDPKMPILHEHERDRVVGFGQAYKDGDNLFIEGEFSKVTKDALEVLQLADEGFPWQASVGIWPDQYKILESKKEVETVNGYEVRGPAIVYQKSHVREVSFVALGADPDTAAIALSEDLDPGVEITQRSEPMDKEQLKKEHPELFEAITSEAFQLGQTTERGRVVELLEAGADPVATLTAVKEGTGAAEAFKAFYAAEKQKRADGLQNLAALAPASQGSEPPAEPAPQSGDAALMAAARKFAAENGLSLEKALDQVKVSRPDLVRSWKPVV